MMCSECFVVGKRVGKRTYTGNIKPWNRRSCSKSTKIVCSMTLNTTRPIKSIMHMDKCTSRDKGWYLLAVCADTTVDGEDDLKV